mmetsp:Transcript_105786/g.207476  ORF Transcript_105786/g.207476 Transcript_105786/m.207476 type:complete len:243 (+) Transcript_105786:171-899(+)
MIQVRDESRGNHELPDVNVHIDSYEWKSSTMDRHPLQRSRLQFPVPNGYDYSLGASKELSIDFSEHSCARSTSHSVDIQWPPLKLNPQGSSIADNPISLLPFIGFSSSSDCPATRALEMFRDLEQDTYNAMDSTTSSSPKRMIQSGSLKRNRSSMGQFDFADLLDATRPVEDSIAFPSIDWNFDDEDDTVQQTSSKAMSHHFVVQDDQDDDLIENPRPKRHCRGLVRSKEVACNLHRLEGIS